MLKVMKHSLKLVSLALVIGLAAFAAFDGGAAPIEKAPVEKAFVAQETKLVLRLETPDTSLKVKEQPQVKVTITHNGDKMVTLIQPGDGSKVGWRTPRCELVNSGSGR